MIFLSLILTLAIISCQLIKIPFFGSGGFSILDIVIIFFCTFGLVKKKFRLGKPPLPIIAALVFIFISIISLVFTPIRLTFPQYLISFSYTLRFFLYIL